MGEVVEDGVGVAAYNSPQKAAIEEVQRELRHKCSVRDETKKVLEFLEKGGNLLDYKLPNVESVSFHSNLLADQLVTNEPKGGFVSVTSSHVDSVESRGGSRVLPLDANRSESLMLDSKTEFYGRDHSLSHSCGSDIVPPERSLQLNRTQKHGDPVGFDLPRKAYERRNRSRPSRIGARSTSADVVAAHGGHATSSSTLGSVDDNGLACEKGKHNMNKAVSPSDGTLVRDETSGLQHCHDFVALKPNECTENPFEGVSQTSKRDFSSLCNPVDEPAIQEMQTGGDKSAERLVSSGLVETQVIDKKDPSAIEYQLASASGEVDAQVIAQEVNGIKMPGEGEKSNGAAQASSFSHDLEGLESKSISPATRQCIDRTNGGEMCAVVQSVYSCSINGNESLPNGPSCMKNSEEIENADLVKWDNVNYSQSLHENGSLPDLGEGLSPGKTDTKNNLLEQAVVEKMGAGCHKHSESDRNHDDPLAARPAVLDEISCLNKHQHSVDTKNSNLQHAEFSRVTDSTHAGHIDEDSILKEAQIIEVKRKRFARFAELSAVISKAEIGWRSQWDYVIEEMAWMSNDFAQERMWKMASAAQISYAAAVACRLKRDKNSCVDAKKVAHTSAKAVLDVGGSIECTNDNVGEGNIKNAPVRAYAALTSHRPSTFCPQDNLSLKPDRTSDLGCQDLAEGHVKFENIFYTAPLGAMETYKKSVLSHVAQIERFGHYIQEEAEMSACGGITEFESQDNAYGEDEGETNAFNMPFTFDDTKPSRYGRKKLKHLKRRHVNGLSEMDSDLLLTQHPEMKLVNQQPGLLTKRSGRTPNVSIPTKHARTASRRHISPFCLGPSGPFQLPSKTDASSCDTSSLQDDQNNLHGAIVFPSTLEVESARDFEKQCPFDPTEVSMVPKKKKAKHMNAAYDQPWQVDSSFHEEKWDHFKRRPKSHLESNGDTGLFGQSNVKKPKVLQQSRDNSSDNFPRLHGSIPSPVASQLSDMHNTNKFVKILGGRNRGRKVKGPKMHVEQPGSGNLWSVFDDQAVVVLVHDLGPNWELVSDAFNSMFHFKCTFRIAKECKERHYTLMDRGSGDGAGSAEDSGSSQPYPSALPGIPKGSARQLFEHLKGPVEEDTLKSHFEKIILIGQTQPFRRSQDPRQIQQPHSSHSRALSQVCPSNLNGGHILTPLDLCDAPDAAPTELQGSHSVGLAASQGMAKPLVPATGVSSALQVPPNMVTGNNFASSPGLVNSSARDGMHAGRRCEPVSADEQQKIQQYNQMTPGRNISQASLPASGTLHSAKRSLLMATQGTSPMASPGSMVSPVASPNMHAGVGTVHGSLLSRSRDGSPSLRPGVHQDSPRQMMMPPELHFRGNSQGVSHFGSSNSPIPSPAGSSPMASYALHHSLPLPISRKQSQALNPPHHANFQGQPNHALNPQQQAYAIHLAKERHRQQMLLQKQQPQPQQQFAASNTSVPPAQVQPQLPISSSMQATSQVQPGKSSPVPLSPLPSSTSMNSVPFQQKGQVPVVGVVHQLTGGSVVASHAGKQQYRHQLNRQNFQPLETQQQVKFAKGANRANLTLQKKNPVDPAVSNEVSTRPISPIASPHQNLGNGNQSVAQRNQQNNQICSGKVLGREGGTHQHPSCSSAEVDTVKLSCASAPLSDGVVNPSNIRSSMISLSSNTCETVPQAGHGNGQSCAQRQQQSQIKSPKSAISQSQQLLQSAQDQQQAQFCEAVTGNLQGTHNDSTLS